MAVDDPLIHGPATVRFMPRSSDVWRLIDHVEVDRVCEKLGIKEKVIIIREQGLADRLSAQGVHRWAGEHRITLEAVMNALRANHVLLHELVHAHQCEREGPFDFMRNYFDAASGPECFSGPHYTGNPYEREAEKLAKELAEQFTVVPSVMGDRHHLI